MIAFLFIFILFYLLFYKYKHSRRKIKKNIIKIDSIVKINSDTLKEDSTCIDRCIPKIIHQTYYDKTKIPQKVYYNIDLYASDYTHRIYDDKEGIEFLQTYFTDRVVDKFNSLKNGAHKADLLRYCLLYIYGGVYLDIKTELIKPLSLIIENKYNNEDIDIYSVLSIIKNTVYQGIIAAPPRKNFFILLINYILLTPPEVTLMDYLVFTRDFYNNIKRDLEKKNVKPGLNKGKNDNFYLFTENCSEKNYCYDGKDRYGLCCYVYDGDEKVFKTRYSDFPW